MHVVGIIFFAVVIAVEVYYWFVYFPRAYAKPGTNSDIDLIREVLRK